MQIKLTVGLEGPGISLVPGDIYECDDDEGARLLAAGFAEPDVPAMERAVKRRPAETRADPDPDPDPDPAPEPEAPLELDAPAEPEAATSEGEANA